MQEDRGVVQVAQDVDAEGVDDAVGDENGSVDSYGFRGRRDVGGFD